MISKIANIANKLDNLGLTKEADVLDRYLNKLAQQVATTGVAGAKYETGRQITPGYAGGKSKVWYRAKPKSISEFNAHLGALMKDIAKNPAQNVFSLSTLKNPPSASETRWNQATTGKAFAEYATAAGFPAAGVNWEKFAKENNYEPTLIGIFRFWEDNFDKVAEKGLASYIGEKEEGELVTWNDTEKARGEDPYSGRGGKGVKAPGVGGPDTSWMKEESVQTIPPQGKDPSWWKGILAKFRGDPLWKRMHQLMGGTGFQIEREEDGSIGIITFTERAINEIKKAQSYEAKAWFSQSPDIILPKVFDRYTDPGNDPFKIKSWAINIEDGAGFNTKNPEVNEEIRIIYNAIAELALQAQTVRRKSREMDHREFMKSMGR
jgi:hypothetical protein